MAQKPPVFLWLLSIVVSLIGTAIIANAWWEVERQHEENFTIIRTVEEFDTFMKKNRAKPENVQFKDGEFFEVPTGFFIQSIAFTSPSTVNVNGFVWKKYPLDFPYEKGVTFPEEVNSNDTKIEKHYSDIVLYKGEEHELIGWYFDVTMRQPFNYKRYPLDYLTIWLRIWPKEFDNDEDILLVPDFDSYYQRGKPRFGLDQDIVTGEWEIEETFFSYRDVPYDTRFGYPIDAKPAVENEIYSELYVNFGATRKFFNAFIINLVPLFVVALLLFSALMTVSDREKQAARFGFSTSGILGTCSALFFVVMLSHIQVRSEFPGSGLVYIEYFYLVMYVVILLTALNAYLFSLEALRGRTVLHWRDNLLTKLMFWPSLLWAMAVVSLVVL